MAKSVILNHQEYSHLHLKKSAIKPQNSWKIGLGRNTIETAAGQIEKNKYAKRVGLPNIGNYNPGKTQSSKQTKRS